MNVLVAYATTEGHTRKIAEWTVEWLRRHGEQATIVDTAGESGPRQTDQYDAFILAGSLHMGLHQSSLVKFAQNNLGALKRKPSALVSSSATAAKTDPISLGKANACIDTFIKATGWTPTATKPIGGAMLYTKYNFLLRWILKSISKKEGGPTDTSRDYEFTDWTALGDFLSDFTKPFSHRGPDEATETAEKEPRESAAGRT